MPMSRTGEPLRVLHLRDTERLCGPGKTIRETVRLNVDPGVAYVVAAFEYSFDNSFLRQFDGLCPVWRLPGSGARLPLTAVELARRARRESIGLIHAHDFKTDILALLAGRLARIPVVTTVHGFISIDWKSGLYGAVDRNLLRAMDRVVAVSEAMRGGFERMGLTSAKVRLIRNCIDLSAYPFGYRSNVLRGFGEVGSGDVVVGHVGRLSAEKGQRNLLAVFPRILERVPTAMLVFAGDGPDLEPLRLAAAAPEHRGRVRFLGYRSDVRDVFADLDLFVLSSDTEGLPNVVLEAMALGVPVVATAVGGTPELVRDGVTGILISPADPAALAEAVIRAVQHPQAASERAVRARAMVEREFNMAALIRQTHEMYGEITNGARP
jgi:glycosyltransferase involved in cell wall biosynthesis